MNRRAALEGLASGLELALTSVRHLLGGSDPDDWVDQTQSPLGRRTHCELARRGELGGARKVSGKWLVRRRDLDAYIERAGVASSESDAEVLAFRAAKRGRKRR